MKSVGTTYRVYYYASEGSTEDKVYVYAYDRDHAEDYVYEEMDAHHISDVTASFVASMTEWGVVEERGDVLVRRPIHNAIESEVTL